MSSPDSSSDVPPPPAADFDIDALIDWAVDDMEMCLDGISDDDWKDFADMHPMAPLKADRFGNFLEIEGALRRMLFWDVDCKMWQMLVDALPELVPRIWRVAAVGQHDSAQAGDLIWCFEANRVIDLLHIAEKFLRLPTSFYRTSRSLVLREDFQRGQLKFQPLRRASCETNYRWILKNQVDGDPCPDDYSPLLMAARRRTIDNRNRRWRFTEEQRRLFNERKVEREKGYRAAKPKGAYYFWMHTRDLHENFLTCSRVTQGVRLAGPAKTAR